MRLLLPAAPVPVAKEETVAAWSCASELGLRDRVAAWDCGGFGTRAKMRSDVLVPSELEGTDYLLSSTMRLEDSFLQILGKFKYNVG